MLWCLSPIPLFLYFATLKLGAVIIGGFVAGGGSNETVYLLLNLPPSLLAHCFCLILSAFLYSTLSFVLSPFFTLSPPLSPCSSSPLRCEQVIGWSPLYNPFVVRKCIFFAVIQNLNLHFKTPCSFPSKCLRDEDLSSYCTSAISHPGPSGLKTARLSFTANLTNSILRCLSCWISKVTAQIRNNVRPFANYRCSNIHTPDMKFSKWGIKLIIIIYITQQVFIWYVIMHVIRYILWQLLGI